ncbi:MAG: MEDS domain-containing protein [Bacteriovoracaceae bacterium]|nr:MEDS domain-containing protein [Bacteriovoracaceae bacterium]
MLAHQDHQVQFYDHSAFLAERVANYLSEGLMRHEAIVVAARLQHWESIRNHLINLGHPVDQLVAKNQIAFFDANEILKQILIGSCISYEGFNKTIRPAVMAIGKNFFNVRIYGEIVDILMDQHNFEAARDLEKLWHNLRKENKFHLLCGYQMDNFVRPEFEEAFAHVCVCHSKVHSLEGQEINSQDNRLAAMLEQKTRSLKLARDEIKRLSKFAVLGEMSAGIAHELNNPLAVTITALEKLEQDQPTDPQTQTLLKLAKKANERIKGIVQNIRIFSREAPLKLGHISLTDIVTRIYEYAKEDLVKQDIELTLSLDAHYSCMGEALAFEQVLLNLINNARDAVLERHLGGGGKIEIIVKEEENHHVSVTVVDNGPGIDEFHLKKIFTPFFTTKSENKGTGLGLSICYSIIRQHGGTLSCSSALLQGTSFKILVPATKTL